MGVGTCKHILYPKKSIINEDNKMRWRRGIGANRIL